jgi:hypothetical protein
VVARYAGRDATWGIPYSYPVYFLNHHKHRAKIIECLNEHFRFYSLLPLLVTCLTIRHLGKFCVRATIQAEFALQPITFRAEDLQVFQRGFTAFGYAQNVVKHKLFAATTIGAGFPIKAGNFGIPDFVMFAQDGTFGGFDLRGNPSFVGAFAPKRKIACIDSAGKELAQAAVFAGAIAAMGDFSTVSTVHN